MPRKFMAFVGRGSLSTKFITAFAAFIVVFTLLVLLYFPAQFEGRERAAATVRAKTIADITAYSLTAPVVFHDSTGIRDVILAAREAADVVFVDVRDDAGRSIQRYEVTPHPDNIAYVESRVLQNGFVIGSVNVGISLEEMLLRLMVLRITIVATGVLVAVVGLLGMTVMIRIITKPLRNLRDVVDRVSEGRVNSRVTVQTNDEIGTVSQAFNAMLDSIEEMQSSLSDVNKRLERRVEERTERLQEEVRQHTRTMSELNREREFIRAVLDNESSVIYVRNRQGYLVLANKAAAALLESTVEALLVRSNFRLFGPTGTTPTDDPDFAVLETGTATVRDELFRGPRGVERWFSTIRSVFTTPSGDTQLLVIATDITDRVRSEKTILAALREKEFLLKEIHHRVKNNMQIISSLLNLQAHTIDDEQTRSLMNQSIRRIRSMALVHEKLYRAKDLASIDLGEYIRSLVGELCRSLGKPGVTPEIQSDHIAVGIDSAIPCGMIVNELTTNALKYAFPGDRTGNLLVSLKKVAPETLMLRVEDDGVGIPEAIDIYQTQSLGMQLVLTLVGQMDGTCTLTREGGTRFALLLQLGQHHPAIEQMLSDTPT